MRRKEALPQPGYQCARTTPWKPLQNSHARPRLWPASVPSAPGRAKGPVQRADLLPGPLRGYALVPARRYRLWGIHKARRSLAFSRRGLNQPLQEVPRAPEAAPQQPPAQHPPGPRARRCRPGLRGPGRPAGQARSSVLTPNRKPRRTPKGGHARALPRRAPSAAFKLYARALLAAAWPALFARAPHHGPRANKAPFQTPRGSPLPARVQQSAEGAHTSGVRVWGGVGPPTTTYDILLIGRRRRSTNEAETQSRPAQAQARPRCERRAALQPLRPPRPHRRAPHQAARRRWHEHPRQLPPALPELP